MSVQKANLELVDNLRPYFVGWDYLRGKVGQFGGRVSLLSGSTNGKAIKVGATSTPGTLLHTAVAGTDVADMVWLAVTNTSASDVAITVEWGDTTSPDNLMTFTVPAKDGWYWIAKGLPLNNGLVIGAFAGTTNVLTVMGFAEQVLTSEYPVLSGSTNGKAIKVGATSTPGTLLHTAVAGTSSIDWVWLAVTNTSASDVAITVEWGGTTSPDNLMTFTVPAKDGWYWIAKGLPLNNGLVIGAFAGTTNVLTVMGFAQTTT